MEYIKINKQAYKIHFIKTGKFKKVKIRINFKEKATKEIKACFNYIRSFSKDIFTSFEEKEILETKKSATTNVPVYDAEIPTEDTVQSDPIEQGDTVSHAKYGVGVVEKMIKYVIYLK